MKTGLNVMLFFAGLCLSMFAYKPSVAQNRSSHPNIVFILADDLGYGNLGCYGQEKIETPNIDALAKDGMMFTQHYSNPVCAPSRYSLMTGKNAGHAFIRGNDEWEQRGDIWDYKAMELNPSLEGQLPIPDSALTVAEILKGAGYKTALVGKWGLGGPFTTGIPNNQGFDYFFGFLCQREDHTYYPGHLWENTFRVPLNNKVVSPFVKFPKDLDPRDTANYTGYAQEDYAPAFLIRSALNFIRKNYTHPFFLYFASPLPHAALQAPQKWVDHYIKKFGTDEDPYLGGSYFPCRYPRATFAAMVSLLDAHVGEIVKELKELGVYDNTLIVFMGDNGYTFEGGTPSRWFNAGGPLGTRKGKGKESVYEGGIRVPFIVSWPGRVAAGSKSDLVSAEWDFVPTVCQLTGVKQPLGIQGISYLPTLLNQPEEQKKHPYLYWEYPDHGGKQAVRIGDWKGIRENIGKGNTKIKLFDLENDLQELHDVAAQHPDLVNRMERIMKKEHQMPAVAKFKMKALDQ